MSLQLILIEVSLSIKTHEVGPVLKKIGFNKVSINIIGLVLFIINLPGLALTDLFVVKYLFIYA